MSALVGTVTVRTPDGTVAGVLRVGADGRVDTQVHLPASAEAVRSMAAHLARPRAPRPRPSCVTPSRP